MLQSTGLNRMHDKALTVGCRDPVGQPHKLRMRLIRAQTDEHNQSVRDILGYQLVVGLACVLTYVPAGHLDSSLSHGVDGSLSKSWYPCGQWKHAVDPSGE